MLDNGLRSRIRGTRGGGGIMPGPWLFDPLLRSRILLDRVHTAGDGGEIGGISTRDVCPHGRVARSAGPRRVLSGCQDLRETIDHPAAAKKSSLEPFGPKPQGSPSTGEWLGLQQNPPQPQKQHA